MRRWAGLGLLLGLLIPSVPAGAQLGPPPEMKRLEFLIGTGTVIQGADEQRKVGIEKFTTTGRWLSDGWQLALEVDSTIKGKRGVVLDVITFNPSDNKYHRWQFARGYTEPAEITGSFEGDRLVFQSEPAGSGSGGFGFRSVDKGYEVASVFPNGAAARTDLKVGDIVTHAEGKSILTPEGRQAMRGKEGEQRHLTVLRGDRSHEIALTLRPPVHTYLAFQPLPNHQYKRISGFMVGDQPGQIGETVLSVRR